MKRYGLIGFPLSHSFSQRYFTEKFAKENIAESVYENFAIESIVKFPELIQQYSDLCGMNVTIPYKVEVMKYLDEVNETASEVGAVNTVKFEKSTGKTRLIGYNTDIYGFEITLSPLLEKHHTKALILGNGGASKAVKYVLKKLGISFVFATITSPVENEITYESIDKELIDECKLIVNCTPLGTYPNVDTCPNIPYEFISNKHILYDLVYNPEVTKFMQQGMNQGAKVQNGLKMLHAQAEGAWKIFNR